jgi:ankyrin repeat protein
VRATTRLGGYTPLHLASQAAAVDVVKTLVAGGANVNAPTATGATPLMLAATSGRIDVTNALLELGADANATEAAHGQTAMMFAAALDRADVVRLLLEHAADARRVSTVVDRRGTVAPEDALQQSIRETQNARGNTGAAAARPAAAPARAGQAN